MDRDAGKSTDTTDPFKYQWWGPDRIPWHDQDALDKPASRCAWRLHTGAPCSEGNCLYKKIRQETACTKRRLKIFAEQFKDINLETSGISDDTSYSYSSRKLTSHARLHGEVGCIGFSMFFSCCLMFQLVCFTSDSCLANFLNFGRQALLPTKNSSAMPCSCQFLPTNVMSAWCLVQCLVLPTLWMYSSPMPLQQKTFLLAIEQMKWTLNRHLISLGDCIVIIVPYPGELVPYPGEVGPAGAASGTSCSHQSSTTSQSRGQGWITGGL